MLFLLHQLIHNRIFSALNTSIFSFPAFSPPFPIKLALQFSLFAHGSPIVIQVSFLTSELLLCLHLVTQNCSHMIPLVSKVIMVPAEVTCMVLDYI